MKKWLFLLGVIVLIFLGGYFALSYFAVKFINIQLPKMVGPGLTVAEIKVNPTYLSVKGVQYEDPPSRQRFIQIEEMRIYPSLFSFLKGTMEIREWSILQPSFFFYRSQEGVFIGPWLSMEKKEKGREISDEGGGRKKEPIRIQIGQFHIQNGSIDFEDRKVGEPPAKIRLRKLDLRIKDIQYPLVSHHSPIELKVKMKGKEKEGTLETQGWIDLQTADMETLLKLREIEIKSLEPYYRKRVSAEVEAGCLDMDATIALKNKRIDAPGQLELIDLQIKEEGTIFWIPAKTVISQLKKIGNRVKVNFHLKGNMNDPRFKLQETVLTRIGISLAEAMGIPIKIVGETLLEGNGKGAEGLIEGLKSIEGLIKKKKGKN